MDNLIKSIKNLFQNQLILIGVLLFMVIYFAALFTYLVEANSNSQFQSIKDGLWWSIVTVATVGYGDKAPITDLGRVIGSLTIISSVVLVSLFTATISSLFVARTIKESQGLQKIKFKEHILICGWNNKVENLLWRLNSCTSKKASLKVVLINDNVPEKINPLFKSYPNLQINFIRGDFSKEAILERANVNEAKSVVILPDILNPSGVLSDEKSLHSLISIKGLNQKIKVFVYITESDNYLPLKRAEADEVILSDQHIDFFLANHIVNPGTAELTLDLLDKETENNIQRISIPKNFVGKTFEEFFINYKKEKNITIIGIVKEEEAVGLKELISHDLSAIDQFIDRKFQEAGVNVSERKSMRVNVNPDLNYVIQEKDLAIVIGSGK